MQDQSYNPFAALGTPEASSQDLGQVQGQSAVGTRTGAAGQAPGNMFITKEMGNQMAGSTAQVVPNAGLQKPFNPVSTVQLGSSTEYNKKLFDKQLKKAERNELVQERAAAGNDAPVGNIIDLHQFDKELAQHRAKINANSINQARETLSQQA